MNERNVISVDGRSVNVGSAFTAADVLAAAGIDGDGVVIRIDGGLATRFAPDGPIEITAGSAQYEFRTFRGAAAYQLRVGGVLWDWGEPAISEDDLRLIAGVPEDRALQKEGVDDALTPGELVNLDAGFAPRLRVQDLGPEPATLTASATMPVPIVVNGRSLTMDRENVTFEDLVGLAFPGSDLTNPGTRALTVTYRRGPSDRPEGTLVSREAIRVQRGEVFNVTATGKA